MKTERGGLVVKSTDLRAGYKRGSGYIKNEVGGGGVG